jgi:hypothetical protein
MGGFAKSTVGRDCGRTRERSTEQWEVERRTDQAQEGSKQVGGGNNGLSSYFVPARSAVLFGHAVRDLTNGIKGQQMAYVVMRHNYQTVLSGGLRKFSQPWTGLFAGKGTRAHRRPLTP